MRPSTDTMYPSVPNLERQLLVMRLLMGALATVGVLLTVAYFVGFGDTSTVQVAEAAVPAEPAPTAAPVAGSSTTVTTAAATTSSSTTSSSTTTTTVPAGAPPHIGWYDVAPGESEPQAKQLAADVAYLLTTYETTSDPMDRLRAISPTGTDLLAEASAPLTHPGSWSRGEVIYPQLGGLANGLASVMVVTRQTVGTGSEADFSVVRTLDIRLVQGESGWRFDSLASAGGVFDDLESLTLAHAVANDPRIVMPDSARLDILAGEISPILLELMADLADITPYGISVMATGHPYHVFETDRVSHHTLGRAIDIYLIGDAHVIDDRDADSATRAVVDWLHAQPNVVQVGSPWDLDGDDARRSFTDTVHHDHIHVAVVEEA